MGRTQASLLADEPSPKTDGDGMGPGAGLTLCEQVADVGLDRLFREEEPLPDLAIDQPLRDQLEHLDLACGRLLFELAERSCERDDLGVALPPLRGHLVETTGMAHVSGQDFSALRSIHDVPRIGLLERRL